ncbi:MAG: hypothetical protein ABIT71_03430 [Vicinamibacteraceae bacterium]
MTIWTRILYCETSPGGDVFTLLERAQGSQAIRRSAVMRLTEQDARRVLADMGESGDAIDAMIGRARVRKSQGVTSSDSSRGHGDRP